MNDINKSFNRIQLMSVNYVVIWMIFICNISVVRADDIYSKFNAYSKYTTPNIDAPITAELHNHYQLTISKSNVSRDLYNDIKSHIKRVLYMDMTNTSLDMHIKNMFNIENSDPRYVFKLPGIRNNQTIVLKRSYFKDAIFPQIPPLKRMIMNSSGPFFKRFSVGSPNRYQSYWAKTLTGLPEKNYLDYRLMDLSIDLDEAESIRVVEENVRTERNFLKYMDQLNNQSPPGLTDNRLNEFDLVSDGTTVKKKYYPSKNVQNTPPLEQFRTHFSTEKQLKINWDDLGLEGWSGGLKSPINDMFDWIPFFQNLPRKSSKSTALSYAIPNTTPMSTKLYATSVDQPPSKKDDVLYSNKKKKYPINNLNIITSTTSHGQENDLDSWEIDMKIPIELTKLLDEEQQKFATDYYLKARQRIPKWPVTNSRAEHRDDDIFIGRANNPFGHSTKWYYNTNSTDQREGRSKRGVIELYSMIKCSTGCDPLIYKGYGCFCGFLGAGQELDGIDRCCKMHDSCYSQTNCPKFLEYFVPYLWKCYRGRPLCAIDHGEWGGPGSCASRLCECDQVLSKCLRRFHCPRKRAVCTSSPWRLLQNFIMEF